MAYISAFISLPLDFRTSSICSSPKPSLHYITRSISCKSSTSGDHQYPTTTRSRRDVVFGLGGLYYASIPLWDRSDFGSQGKAVALAAEANNMELTPISAFPLDLDKAVSTEVSRPKKSRSKEEKEEEEEVLVIEGIDFERNEFVKFDVYVNYDDIGANKTELAGSFANVPHRARKRRKTSLTLAINELLEDLEAEDDDSLVVTLVPRSGKNPVSIGGVKIDYVRE